MIGQIPGRTDGMFRKWVQERDGPVRSEIIRHEVNGECSETSEKYRGSSFRMHAENQGQGNTKNKGVTKGMVIFVEQLLAHEHQDRVDVRDHP